MGEEGERTGDREGGEEEYGKVYRRGGVGKGELRRGGVSKGEKAWCVGEKGEVEMGRIEKGDLEKRGEERE